MNTRRSISAVLGLPVLPGALVLSALLLAPAMPVSADDGKLVVAASFTPASGFALETDDAFVLTRVGCMEALARRDFDGSLQPALAESWERHSPTEWDFKIRSGVTFQDGSALNAKVVSDNLNALLTAAAPPRPFRPKSVSSVEAVDDMTVRITTPSPSVLLPYRLAAPNTGILSPAAYKDGGIDPVGTCTGPFEIVEHVPQQALILKRNESYWDGKAALAEVEFRFIPEGAGRATQLKTGEAHVSTDLPITEVLSLRSDDSVEILTVEQARTTSLYLNNQRAALDNEKVRQAIQSAIDAEAIAAAIYEGAARPAVGPFAPGDPWAPDDASVIPHDKARAMALLKESGVDAGSIKLNLLAYVERSELPDLAAVVQAQLGEIGIDVELRIANYGALEPDLLEGNFDMLLLSRGYLSDVADPIGFLTADYTCEGGYNLSHFCDPAIDAKVEAAGAAETADERYALYKEIASELQARAVTVFVIHQQRSDGTVAGVQNYKVHPDAHYQVSKELSLSSN